MNQDIPINTITNEDCITFIPKIPDNSIDLIVTDPPYNISSSEKKQLGMKNIHKKPGFGGDWNIMNEEWDTYSFEDYCFLIKGMLKESYRVLKSTGSAFLFGTYHNIGIINYYAILTGFNIINEIIWYKRNAFPNLSQKCLTASHENILWLAKSNTWNYNYDEIKKTSYPFDSLKEPNKQLRSVWDIPNNKQKNELAYRKAFPDQSYWIKSQKPLRLIDRCIELVAQPCNILADWFAGSGTTLISALNHSLSFVGCESNPRYVEVIRWRLNQINHH